MPISLTPGHDNLAQQLQPAFINKMLLDFDHDQHLMSFIVQLLYHDLAPLTTNLPSNAKHNSVTIALRTKLHSHLLSYESAIATKQLHAFRDINNQFIFAFEEWLTETHYVEQVDLNTLIELKDMLNNQPFQLSEFTQLKDLALWVHWWQMQILHLCFDERYTGIAFPKRHDKLNLAAVNFLEIGLNPLPDS